MRRKWSVYAIEVRNPEEGDALDAVLVGRFWTRWGAVRTYWRVLGLRSEVFFPIVIHDSEIREFFAWVRRHPSAPAKFIPRYQAKAGNG